MKSIQRKQLLTQPTPQRMRAWCLPIFLAAGLLAAGPVVRAADEKASKFYEDALVRYEKKDLDGAIIQLKNALQIDRNMLPVQVLLGKALLGIGKVKEALNAINQSIAIREGVELLPESEALLQRGIVLKQSGAKGFQNDFEAAAALGNVEAVRMLKEM